MKSTLVLLFLLYIGTITCAQQPAVVSAYAKLNTELTKLKKDPDLLNASWGVCVRKCKTDSLIAAYNMELSLVPASTLKVLTTGAALFILGNNYRYETLIQYDGSLDTVNGVLTGNVYIKGSGDPSLGSEYFRDKKDTVSLTDKWAGVLKKKGIKKITGSVIADASCFEEEMTPSTWIWGDMGNYYGAGACGLSYIDNKYTVFFNSPITNGDSVSIASIVPFVPGMNLKNKVTSGGSKDNAFIYGAPYCNERYVTGTIPAGKTNFDVEGALPDPSWYCAQAFTASLRNKGIKVEKEATAMHVINAAALVVNDRKTLHKHLSPTLEKIVYYTNMKSNNLYAEALLKTIALVKNGFGDDQAGIDLVEAFWSSKGVDTKGLYMSDGSGLSRSNAVTPKTETSVLRVIASDSLVFKAIYNSLPVAGKSTSFGEGSVADNNLRVKSGYITRARSYTGYVTNRKGEMLVFSMIFNNYSCTPTEAKKKMEKLMVLIASLD